jgi:hypothetical protein
MGSAADEDDDALPSRSDPWTDLGLTLPVFVLYHLGVVFLPVRNAADPVTSELKALANQSLPAYAGLTVAIGGAFILVLSMLGRGRALSRWRFVSLFVEGIVYALAMRMVGAWAIGALPLLPGVSDEAFSGFVMSLGAGFYEELAFRVGLFGVVALFIRFFWGSGVVGVGLTMGWAVVAALAFSGWHHVGPLADPFDATVFVYRAVCGLFLTAVYRLRGFAPAVWTHALYDVWALAM